MKLEETQSISEDLNPLLTRRQLLGVMGVVALGFVFSGCNRRYVRPGKYYDLGDVRDTLYPKKHMRKEALLLFRDPQGWAVMSTQCSYDGCYLTYQDDVLLCSCCNSEFTHDGQVRIGPANVPLPWFSLKLQGRHMFANTAEQVAPSYRFTTPELKREAERLEKILSKQGSTSGSRIPNVLMGMGDGEGGEQFRDSVPLEMDSAHDLPPRPPSDD